jgi:hypothetical protein
MEKLLRFLPAFLMVFALVSCEQGGKAAEQPADPFDVLNTELTPTAFTLEGQMGTPVIADSASDPKAGTVSVVIETREVDVKAVTVEDIRVPRAAVASIARGDELDLTTDPTFTVTAEDGSSRTYTILYSEPPRAQGNSLLSFELDGQLGEATITDDGEVGGTIDVLLDPTKSDLSALEVKKVSVSELATASVQVGATVDLSSSGAQIVVTSEAGVARTYAIRKTQPLMTLSFVMAPRQLALSYGYDYTANAVCVDGSTTGVWRHIADKYTLWEGEERLNDYTLKLFITEGTLGAAKGVVVLAAKDGLWFDFVFKDPNTGTLYDLTDIYQIVPKGVSTFTMTGTEITFFVDGLEYGKTVLYGPSDPTGANPVTIASKISGTVLTIGKTGNANVGKEAAAVTAGVYGLYTERNIHTSTATTDKGNYVDNVDAVLWLIKLVM